MMNYRIKTINNISAQGLRVFDKEYEIGDTVKDPDAIIIRSSKINAGDYPHLLAIARAGVGVNNIDVDYSTDHGICVFNTPGANANAVAELVFFVMGLAARNIDSSLTFVNFLKSQESDEQVKKLVEAQKAKFKGFELAGKQLGVVGLGKIGVKVANLGIHYGMKVYAFDPSPTITNIHHLYPGVTIVNHLQKVVTRADILTVHVPLSPDTKNLISEKELQFVKPHCIMMNFAREGIFNNNDIIAALRQNRLSWYITDFPTLHLIGEKRIICTPHLGASTSESEIKCAEMAAIQVKNYLELGNIENSVNFPFINSTPQKSAVCRLIVINRDIPNMIAYITSIIGGAGINIQSLINESNGKIGYNVIDMDTAIHEEVMKEIEELENVIRVRLIQFRDTM